MENGLSPRDFAGRKTSIVVFTFVGSGIGDSVRHSSHRKATSSPLLKRSREMGTGLQYVALLISVASAAVIESVSANVDSTASRKHEHFVPLVAFECGYRNKYMSPSGEWVTDSNRYATCQTGKLDILKYCKKAYPTYNVTNIMEYSHEVSIDEWCREEGTPCKWTHTVRPYQCIVGEFHSEALQVPHDCRFSHVNSRDSCNDYTHWQNEATKQCASKTANNGKKMAVRSFAVLEPCGLDLFIGVEFVCCPTDNEAVVEKVTQKAKDLDDELYDDEDSVEDDEDDEDSDSDEEEVTSAEQDPYFKKNDPGHEHENFKNAAARLDKKHRDKITRVMKEWGELETRYKKMAAKDAKGAEAFKTEMTNRFQKTVAALEAENKALKTELETTHEQRVQEALNEKKRQATHDYRHALAMHVSNPNKHRVLTSLKTYIRAEEKDRIHMLNRYRHLLRSDETEAAKFKPMLLHRLRYIDLRINGTLAMLRDFPDLEIQVRPIAVEFWADLRKENTPEITDEEINKLNTLNGDAQNHRLLDIYKKTYDKLHPLAKLDVKAPAPTTQPPVTEKIAEKTKVLSDDGLDSEEENDEYYEDEDDEEIRKPVKKPEEEPLKVLSKVEQQKKEIELSVEVDDKPVMVNKGTQTDDSDDDDSDESDSDEDDDINVKELRVDIEPIIEEKPFRDVHAAPAYYRHEKLVQSQSEAEVSSLYGLGGAQTLVVMGAVVLLAMLVLVVVNQRRSRAHAGFIEVDVCTPEERHVSGMQVNGYENPTYSFFDAKP